MDVTIPTLSSLGVLHPPAAEPDVTVIEARYPSKALASEYGWAFLINDTNRFLESQFGTLGWTASDRARATATIRERRRRLGEAGIAYAKFIIPEKSVVYRQYLPACFAHLTQREDRPAVLMQTDNPGLVFYLDAFLQDAGSYGLTYFRGDTHTNWLGGWLVYWFVADWLRKTGVITSKLIEMKDLVPSVAGYDGDLITQVSPAENAAHAALWGMTRGQASFEWLLKLDLIMTPHSARRVDVPATYKDWFVSRETLVYERPDRAGPRAVIFRDSTFDRSHELLAQHFSRSVFVWHNGLVYKDLIEIEKPDVVIHAMAERFVIRYDTVPPFASIKDFP